MQVLAPRGLSGHKKAVTSGANRATAFFQAKPSRVERKTVGGWRSNRLEDTSFTPSHTLPVSLGWQTGAGGEGVATQQDDA